MLALSALMRRCFKNSAQVLKDYARGSRDYRVLECIGFMEEPGSEFVGFLGRLPNTVYSDSKFVDLHQLITQSSDKKPDLDLRVGLAKTLSISLYQIHSSGWVHKNF
ncbi:MAG: hypothetical protein MMC33_003735 [Icmadophila ericetorum]|nr:hypothetical protein [Icmadophila ericetorum]